MVRMFLILVALTFVLACGGQEAAEPAGEPPAAVDAAIVEEDVVGATGGEALPDDGDAKACLQLIDEGKYQDAVAVCAQAAQLDPSNTDVQKALADAKAKSAMPDRGDAASCLDLVAQAKWDDAITVCAEAVELDPANTAVSEALAKAKQEASQAAAAAAGKASELLK